MTKIKVLIVDDSKLIRNLLAQILGADRLIEVVGEASDPFDAREKINQLNPDVLTLDVEMPRMDGITFLKNLMRLRPMPVVMISTLTQKGTDTTLEALAIGAIDYIAKPKLKVETELSALAEQICGKVKQAARANVAAHLKSIKQAQVDKPVKDLPLKQPNKKVSLLAIGASTGGTEAIKEVLSHMPEQMPPIVVVQHMPAGFTASFSQRLDRTVKLKVEEFCDSGQTLKANHVYIAHGASHLKVRSRGGVLTGYIEDSEPVNRHMPSVDALFDSVASSCGMSAIGVLLTGMGIDGASGLGNMRAANSMTIAQDEQSSVVWGMPRVAIQQGAASEVLPLAKIGSFLVDACYAKK